MAVILTIKLGLFCQSVQARARAASVELAEILFNDPTLGGSTNPVNCSACHPGGQALEKAEAQPTLSALINICIQRPLKGKNWRKIPSRWNR